MFFVEWDEGEGERYKPLLALPTPAEFDESLEGKNAAGL